MAVVLLFSAVASACTTADRYAPKFGAAQRLSSTGGVTALALDGTDVYFAAGGDVFRVNSRQPAQTVRIAGISAESLAVFRGRLYASWTDPAELVHVVRVSNGVPTLIWLGRSLAPTSHIDFDPDGRLYVSMGDVLEQIDRGGKEGQVAKKVTDGWVDAYAFDVDEHNRVWVVDQPGADGKAFVARGRERDHAKRRRFATALPAGSTPSAVATRVDEALVCRSSTHDVFRLHIGLDNTARRRNVVKGLVCDGAIATMADGSVVTATHDAILRYGAR